MNTFPWNFHAFYVYYTRLCLCLSLPQHHKFEIRLTCCQLTSFEVNYLTVPLIKLYLCMLGRSKLYIYMQVKPSRNREFVSNQLGSNWYVKLNQKKIRGQRGRLQVQALGYVNSTKVIFGDISRTCFPRRPH